MAGKVLNEVMKGNVTWDDFVLWLNPKGLCVQGCFNTECSQGDFVVHIVNLLHDEVSSFIQKSCKGNVSSKKNITSNNHPRNKASCGRRNENFSSSHNSPKVNHVTLPGCGFSNHSLDLNHSGIGNCALSRSFDSPKNTPAKSQHLMNGVKYGNVNYNTSPKPTANLLVHSLEKKCEATFIHNCHLSPIPKDVYLTKSEKRSSLATETDSPNNRVVHRDGKACSARKSSIQRATSSPCSSFNIAEHTFPAIDSPGKQNLSRKRRIKPTRLADSFERGNVSRMQAGSNFGDIVRNVEQNTSFTDNIPSQEKENNSISDFRSLLRLEKQKLQKNNNDPMPTVKNSQVPPVVPASSDSVQFRNELLIFAKLYSLFLEFNLICNITSEFHLIFSLLIVQDTSALKNDREESECSTSKYFISVNECVFFATAILNEQRLFLSTLDKACLKLLINNKRISSFTPNLWEYLCDLYQLRSTNRSLLNTSSVFHNSVCFQSDTDNRENFPNDKAFSSFRKQRDAFYEILAIWEENHSNPGWSFNVALGQRVRNLLGMNDEPANFIHFARLFKSQLLGSCRKTTSPVEDESNDSLAEVIKCLKEGNPDKYTRLYERLVTPLKSSNSNVAPDFPGQQEFFKDFIVSACNAIFNNHLTDCLWNEIQILDNTCFSASEVEDGDTTVDKDTKRAFITCVNNLQLLAKFLGFIKFLPYRTNSILPESLVEKQVSLRIEVHPVIDVFASLQHASESKKLLLTIPWVVQYLSMVDKVSFTTPYYRDVVSFLFSLYRMFPLNSSPYGCIILKVCLGWLFDLPQLSEDCFYRWCLNESQNCKSLKNPGDSHSVALCVDELDLVEWDSLQAICPFVENLKWLLMSDTNHLSNVVTHRHITPVLVATEQLGASSSKRQLELKLEENFFEGQPRSIRQTIEFVAERIASSCVKYICSKPLNETKEKALQLLQSSIDSNCKDVTIGKVPVDSCLLSHELKVFCQDFVPKFCLNKCHGVMPLMLAEDVPEDVTRMCVQIASRLSIEKVNVWINSHITPALFAKDLASGTSKICRNSSRIIKSSHVLSNGWRDVSAKDAGSPAESLAVIRRLMWRIMGNAPVEEAEVLSVLESVLNTLQSRRDLIPSAERVLGNLTVDLAFILLAHCPRLMKTSILNNLLLIWQTPEVASSGCFQHLICPRNIMILRNCVKKSETWSTTAKFLSFVLQNGLVPPSDFETQSVALFQQEWPQDILRNLASCFEDVAKIYLRESRDADSNFALLLELVSDLCYEMDEDF